MKDNQYALKRLAKKRAEEELKRSKNKDKKYNPMKDDYNIDRGLKEREMDDNLSDDNRKSAKFRRELREKMAKRQRK